MVHYRRLYSPFIAMAWAASRTTRLSVGTCVSLPGEHDPIVLAKTLASLDAMSGGRVVYGIGFGWLEQEMRDHGVDPKRRRATLREKILAVKAIWTQEEAAFAGEFVRFPACWSWPKPKSLARLPILLGAKGTDQVFDHVIEYCDGWIPPVRESVAEFGAAIRRLKARAEAAGRDPATIRIDVISREQSVARFEGFRAIGVERVILHLPFGDIDTVRRRLDDYARDYVRRFAES
jgi:probable F420-dependent oxidoreductase